MTRYGLAKNLGCPWKSPTFDPARICPSAGTWQPLDNVFRRTHGLPQVLKEGDVLPDFCSDGPIAIPERGDTKAPGRSQGACLRLRLSAEQQGSHQSRCVRNSEVGLPYSSVGCGEEK